MTIRTLTVAVALLTSIAVAQQQRTYVVKKGDTLSKISRTLGVQSAELARANGLGTSAKLKKGQTLVIPQRAAERSISLPAATTAQPTVAPELRTAEITAAVTVQAGPFEGSRPLLCMLPGMTAPVEAERAGWAKIKLPDGGFGWVPSHTVKIEAAAEQPAPVASSFLALAMPEGSGAAPAEAEKPKAPAPKPAENKPGAAASKSALLQRALSYRGVRYRWGGTSRSGVDCSGFTSSVFKAEGIWLPRTSLQQSKVGVAVPKEQLKPGDLVFFRTSRSVRINHVGIYIGDKKFVHASSGSGQVRVSSLGESYYSRCYAGARRVANLALAPVKVEADPSEDLA